MTRRAHLILRAINGAAVLLLGVAAGALMLDAPRAAIAALIPVLFANVLSLEALRAGLAKLEPR